MDLSIIIPAYNRLWCLPAAIESCKSANFKVEVIVVDDGSTDGTQEWLSKQPGIRYLQQSHLGKCWAVNKGFSIAKGKYIRFLDSDDLIDSNANDEQLALAETTNADIVVSGYQLFNDDKAILKTQLWITCDDFIAQQLGECDSSHYSAYLFKREFIADIPHRPDYAFRDDRLFVLEAALKNPVIAIHKGTALLHRIHENNRLQKSIGLKADVQHYQHINMYRFILGRLKAEDGLNQRRINAALNVIWPLCTWIAKSNISEAEKIHKWILELKPGFKIPENGAMGALYRIAGFRSTQKILNLRRFIKYGWR